MARSELEIAQSIKNSFKELNPSLDLDVGPTYNYCIRPVPKELARIELEQERLLRFYSQDFPEVATPEEARQFALNFGLSANPGGKAVTSVVFFRTSPVSSGAIAEVGVGVLISTPDGSLVYRTVESKTMFGDFSQTYFNPSTNKFEVEVFVEALNPGTLYNVAPFRVNRIVTGQLPFDGIEQRRPAYGGSEAENSFDLAKRVINQFKGLNLGSSAGIENLVRNFLTGSILDLRIIRPSDRQEFRRPASGPSLDLCVSGFEFLEFTEEYFAAGGETFISIQEPTTTAVSSVRVNGLALDNSDWFYLDDTSLEWRGSTRATSKIEFVTPLEANDIVEIVGTRNYLLDKIQGLFSVSESALFKTDVLVRSFVDLPIIVSLSIKIKNNPSIDIVVVENSVGSIVSSYLESDTIPEALDIVDLESSLRRSLPELESLKVFEFRRQYSSLEAVERISPLKNEKPVFNSLASNLIVRA